ncbi:MAG: hypothetical protein ACREHF_02025 [Rhizomicrobium sp.]
MKKWIAFGALACALALGACATGSTAQQDTEKALIGAHASYDAISVALQTATATGVLHGAAATQAQSAYDQVGQDLAAADLAWDAGNAVLAAADVANAGSDTAKAQALIPAPCISNKSCPGTTGK